MAVSHMSPLDPAARKVSLTEAIELFAETDYPVHKDTLVRQCRRRGIVLERRGKNSYGSWTDLQKVHRDWASTRS